MRVCIGDRINLNFAMEIHEVAKGKPRGGNGRGCRSNRQARVSEYCCECECIVDFARTRACGMCGWVGVDVCVRVCVCVDVCVCVCVLSTGCGLHIPGKGHIPGYRGRDKPLSTRPHGARLVTASCTRARVLGYKIH